MKNNWSYSALCAAVLLASTLPLSSQVLPTGIVRSDYVTGLTRPVQMAFAPDGRLFICEQDGRLRIFKDGLLLAEPFMTLDVTNNNERGLLSVAFDPDFATNQYIYVFYTAQTTPPLNRVSRFTAAGDFVVPGSEKILVEVDVSRAGFHNAGAIHFGPDGKLYISIGDNTAAARAQELTNLYGKILRINSDGTIPTDNPFYSTNTGLNRLIWAYGLRNPFTFNIDPTNGTMFINDVGENTFEEVNRGAAGANYGWNASEGPYNPTGNPAFTMPVFSYLHNATVIDPRTGNPGPPPYGCSVIGGAFFQSTTPKLPNQYVGRYFFGDVCGGWIKTLDPTNNSVEDFGSGLNDPSDIDVGPDGALYYSARLGEGVGSGKVFRIAEAGDRPAVTVQPADVRVTVGHSASFSVTASGTAPLSYQWRRNGTPISGATSATYTIPSPAMADNGAIFSVVISNSLDNVTSRDALLTVTENQAPTATILTPAAGTLYQASTTVTYSASATDSEDGELPASAFTWSVVFHHDTHTHPFQPEHSGSTTGSFFVPPNDHTEDNVWYRVHLTVKDSGGLTYSTYRDVFPRKSTITLNTVPPGLLVSLNTPPLAAPLTSPSVVGVIRTLDAVTPQTKEGVSYEFVSWSDGRPANHTIVTPATNTTYTATFRVACGSNANSRVSVAQGGYRLNMATQRYVQVVTLRNMTGAPVQGPVSLALDGLSTNASLFNMTGVTSCSAPSGSPFVSVNVGPDNILSPGEAATVFLEYVNPTNQGITYIPRVVSGAGGR